MSHAKDSQFLLPEEPNLIGFKWLDLRHAVENEPRPLDFILPGFKSGTVGALVSMGGTGKTMLALQCAITVATGFDMLELAALDSSWRPATGRVVLLTGEDDADVLDGRIHAIGAKLPLSQREAMYENMAVAPLVGRGVDLMHMGWQRWIKEATAGARLIVFDTLRRFHQLDENDSGQMAQLLALLEQLCRENHTAALFLHHTNKLGGGSDAQQASRGSSVLTDNARFQANLVGMSKADAEEYGVHEDCRRSFVRLSFPKINYSAPLSDRWFRRREGGVLEPTKLEPKRRDDEKKGTAERRVKDGF